MQKYVSSSTTPWCSLSPRFQNPRLLYNEVAQDFMVPTVRAQNLLVINPSYGSIGSKVVTKRAGSDVSCGMYCDIWYVEQAHKVSKVRL